MPARLAPYRLAMGYFYDPADDDGPLRLELLSINGTQFHVLRQMAYRSNIYDEPFVFPGDLTQFRTDLASVPELLTWLVPRTGDFLPAAVLHDSLLENDYRGPAVSREDADDIFRIAMDELGTGRVRSWLMWAAVSLASMWHSREVSRRLVLGGVLGAIVVLGVVSTLDLLDLWNVMPWMGDRPWYVEIVAGFAAAVLIPAVLAVTWGRRRRRAGAIAGVCLALLLHVTIALAMLYGIYRLAEFAFSGHRRSDGVYVERRLPDAPGRP